MFRAVGETADSVSKRKLEPLPKVRFCWVLMVSFGRCVLRWEHGCDGRGDGEMAKDVDIAGGRRWEGCGSEVCCIGTGSTSVMWVVLAS